MKIVLNLFKFVYRNINLKMGAIGGVLMGSVAYYPNLSYGFDVAIIPALKQFVYTLIVGGSLVRITERISVSMPQRGLSIFLAFMTPTAITAVLITSIHVLKGTPNPLETILYTVLAAPPGFIFVAFYTRRKHDNSLANEEAARLD